MICSQESLITRNNQFKLNHYNSHHRATAVTNDKAHGGVSLMVNNDIPQREINLDINLHKTITNCNLFILASCNITSDDIIDIIIQLP